MARGFRVTWKGRIASLPTLAQLTALDAELRTVYGFAAVGTPVRRVWAGGIVAVAIYESAIFSLIATGGMVYLTAMIRGTPDLLALGTTITTAFGLTDTASVEDSADL